jgi:hypothetical protein
LHFFGVKKGLKLQYWLLKLNLAHSSHSSCGSGVHLIHKIEKKKEKKKPCF